MTKPPDGMPKGLPAAPALEWAAFRRAGTLLAHRSYQIQNAGAQMGDFNSYFFFAAAAGLMAAAIAIAVISAFLHLREGAAVSASGSAAPVPPDAPAKEGGLVAPTDEGIIS